MATEARRLISEWCRACNNYHNYCCCYLLIRAQLADLEVKRPHASCSLFSANQSSDSQEREMGKGKKGWEMAWCVF